MTGDAPATRYLVHMRLFPPPYSDEKVADRVREAAPVVIDALGLLSLGEVHLAYMSEGGDTFALFVRSGANAREIRDAVQESRAFRAHDHLLVLALGEDFSAVGNNAGWEWLQHH